MPEESGSTKVQLRLISCNQTQFNEMPQWSARNFVNMSKNTDFNLGPDFCCFDRFFVIFLGPSLCIRE